MIWDEEMGGCIDGRRLDSSKYGNYELDNTERDDCSWGMEGCRRLRSDESGVEDKAEGEDCTEENGCEHEEERDDDEERRLAGGAVEGCRGKRCLDDEESSDEEDDDEPKEEHAGDVQADDGAKRLLRAAIQN